MSKTLLLLPAALGVLAVWQGWTPDWAAAAGGPAAWYRFENAQALGQDASGQAVVATVTEGQAVPGHAGQGLALDGRGGLELASAPALQAAQGFALDLWVKLATVADNVGIAAKEGEYLLRIDPPAEGGKLSFFVNAGGSMEPRVSGLKPEADTWYHLIATWDGDTASLWINGQQYSRTRRGAVAPTDSPVLIGKPSHFGPIGVKGVIDEVKLYSRPLAEREIVLTEYPLDKAPAGRRTTDARFTFGQSTAGWEGQDTGPLTVRDGAMRFDTANGKALVFNRSLDVPTEGNRAISVRLAASAGSEGKLLFLTTKGLRAVPFALKSADGALHSYVFEMGDYPEWAGRLQAIGILPANAAASVALQSVTVSREPEVAPEIAVKSLLTDGIISRAGKPCKVVAALVNTGGAARNVPVRLSGPQGVRIANADQNVAALAYGATAELSWEVQAAQAQAAEVTLRITPAAGQAEVTSPLRISFTPPLNLAKASYVPEPTLAPSQYLVGAHYCPLWKQGGRSGGWQEIVPYPDRKPALGWYDEENPEVTDWDIRFAIEHGIQYFVYCWYRKNQGHGVEMFLSHAIHDGLFHARYKSKFKFTIMWENQQKGQAGVASEDDFLNNLMPFWIETYFKNPQYLKVDNKPLLFIYRPEFLVDDLGSVANVRRALDKARDLCKRAGFDGLTVLGEYRGTAAPPLQLMKDEGLDYSFAYCWPIPSARPTDEEAIRAQEAYWRDWQKSNIIPGVVTVSMGWDSTPWGGSWSIWRLKPEEFRTVCQRAKTFMDEQPKGSLQSRMVLLDNWDEFGEGHYIAPHRQYGFGYLDAVRDVFTTAPKQHVDLVPEDVGLGPYDKGFRKVLDQEQMLTKRVLAPGGDEPGLLGWWRFDEAADDPVTWDYSGHGLGGTVDKAKRVAGQHGKALECKGGSVTIPHAGLRFGVDALTVDCWVKTDLAGQSDKWFVNCLYGQGLSGFRLGLSGGKLCWAIPKTAWSHHLQATEALPLGKWVHVQATYDGTMMRILMDGKECGSLERGGRVFAGDHPLTLGSYEIGHPAYFTGLLEDVRVYAGVRR